jgi:hypothetical protein
MHYGHLIKYRYYLDSIFIYRASRKELDSVFFFKCINISDVNIEKIFVFAGYSRHSIIKCRYYFDGIFIIYRVRKERYSVVFKYINITDMNIEKIFEILRNI